MVRIRFGGYFLQGLDRVGSIVFSKLSFGNSFQNWKYETCLRGVKIEFQK